MKYLHNRRNFILLVLPVAVLFTIYGIYPVFSSFAYSLTNFRGMGTPDFVGLANYQRLFGDKYFFRGVGNILKMTSLQIVILLPVSFLLALLINKPGVKNTVYKVVFFSPYVIPGIMSGLIWLFILDPVNGLINVTLREMGLTALAQEWIGGKSLTPYSLAVLGAWSGVGFCMVLWMTGMKGIPEDVVEAAVVDGATPSKLVRYITIPLLRETFYIIFLFTLTGCLKTFETVYQLTGGGPNHYSETIISYMYTTTYVGQMYGYGMAIAVVEFFFAVLIAVVFLKLQRKDVDLA